MAEEALQLHAAMEQPVSRSLAGLQAYEGVLNNAPCLLVECGIGKVAAAAAAQALCDAGYTTGVLVLGIAGGIAPDIHLGDVIAVSETAQHDLDARPFFPRAHVPHLGVASFPADPALHKKALVAASRLAKGLTGARPGPLADAPPQVRTGVILTGDQVIATKRRREALWRAFPDALGVDMETAAVAQVCRQNRVPWAAVRIVSDGLEDRIDPTQVLDYAATAATAFLRDIAIEVVAG
jgi:adenosylhomocysteine nucleosidase